MAQSLKREMNTEQTSLMARIALAEAELESVVESERRLLTLIVDARAKLYRLQNGLVCPPDWAD